ncbi:hypothetical protein ACJMK2_013194 [Sinanodonta woodiana]|uniref:Uncharacterized protein n=1 Tax=Sinanodonta woodiana TaxID=1069815 RepID=A0ABD3UZE0_SINWO
MNSLEQYKLRRSIVCRRIKMALALAGVTTVGLLFFLSMYSSDSAVPRQRDVPCRLDNIRTQQNFDKKAFAGTWYATMNKVSESSIISTFLSIYDIKIKLTLNSDGNYKILSAGAGLYGYYCPVGDGAAQVIEQSQPERMTAELDTRLGRMLGAKPFWVLKTDYTSYALIYSCWEVTADGRCSPDSTYAGVMQRDKSIKLAPSVLEYFKEACVEEDKLTIINHYNYCNIDKL